MSQNTVQCECAPLFVDENEPTAMPITASTLIEVKRSPGRGRGVYAKEFIPAGTVFEVVPLLVIPHREVEDSDFGKTVLQYVFEYGKGSWAIALGFGSLYNHSYNPNARYDDVGVRTKQFSAVRDISSGEEITVNYNGAETILDPVEFDVV